MGVIAENRKPLIILVLCGVVAVVLFAMSVGLGGRDSAGTRWQSRLEGAVTPEGLRAGDLTVSAGSCSSDDDHITVSGPCTLEVPSRDGGGLSPRGVVRQAKLSVSGFPVVVSVVLEGRQITQSLKPGDEPLSLTFGREGGTLLLTCPTGCVVAFAEGGS